jgi:outer membrane protein assembly factor BamB
VPTPIVAHDLVFFSSAHGALAPLYAVRRGATGDITLPADAESSEYIAWYKKRDGIYMQTPLVYGELLYACRDNGVLSCYDAETGEMVYRERVGNGQTGFTASAVAGDGKIFLTSETGEIHVLRAGREFELLSTNAMGDICMATPAISDGTLIIRTKDQVVAIGEKQTEAHTGSDGSTTLARGDGKCFPPGVAVSNGWTRDSARVPGCAIDRCGTSLRVLWPCEGRRRLHLLRN